MKKLVFMFVAMAAISFASCGNSEKAGANADSASVDSQMVEAPATDSLSGDSLNAAADSLNTEAAAADSVA